MFSLKRSSGELEADSVEKLVEIIGGALIEAVNLALSLLPLWFAFAANWAQETGGKWRIGALEELEEGQAERIALGRQLITA